MEQQERYNKDDISAEDFAVWKRLPVTEKIYRHMSEIRDVFLESLINGKTLIGSYGSIEETAKTVGFLRGIDLFLQAEYGDKDNENRKS